MRPRRESVGIDGAALTKLVADIRAGKYSNIHSLLVLRSGKLVLEEYFQGEDERRGQPLGTVRFDASGTKTHGRTAIL